MRCVLLSLAVVILASAGCKHHARKAACNDCLELGEPFPGGGGRISPTEVPLAPRVAPPPPAFIPDTRNYVAPGYGRSNSGLSPASPDYGRSAPASPPSTTTPGLPPREILLPPEQPSSRLNAAPNATPSATPVQSKTNSVRAEPSAGQTRLGLPGYTPVAGIGRVATGRKPTPEGFVTLKSTGVKTVYYLHAPGTDTSAAAQLAEAQGLKLISLAVAPETLAANLADFTRTLGDPNNRPLYVVDETGTRAGSLWYLYFRTREYASDETARIRATPLGLPTDTTTEEAKTFWLAVQKVLAQG